MLNFCLDGSSLQAGLCGCVCCAVEEYFQEVKHNMLFLIISIFLGVIAGIVVAYCALQYSIDLQKLVGLRGRYATATVELQQLKEKQLMASQSVRFLLPQSTNFETSQ